MKTEAQSILYPLNIYDYCESGLLEHRVELAPGIAIFPYSNQDAGLIDAVGKFPQLSDHIGGPLSHLIEIKLGIYRDNLAIEFPREVAQYDSNPDRLLHQAVDGIRKQVCLSLVLAGYFLGFSNTQRYLTLKNKKLASITVPAEPVTGFRPSLIPRKGPPWNEGLFLDKFLALTPFYRSVATNQSRLAVALHAFWIGLTSYSIDQKIIGMTTVFEAIFGGESGGEVVHQLSERLAISIREKPTERLELYHKFKKLYAHRSVFVHGTINQRNKLFSVNAKGAGVKSGTTDAQMAVHELQQLAVEVINKILNCPKWLSAFNDNGDPLTTLYLEWIFGGSKE